MNVYTIRDDAAKYFMPPFTAMTDEVAKRLFIGSMGESFPHRHQFNLFRVGQFDDDNGILSSEESPSHILSGSSVPEELDPRAKTIIQENQS